MKYLIRKPIAFIASPVLYLTGELLIWIYNVMAYFKPFSLKNENKVFNIYGNILDLTLAIEKWADVRIVFNRY